MGAFLGVRRVGLQRFGVFALLFLCNDVNARANICWWRLRRES